MRRFRRLIQLVEQMGTAMKRLVGAVAAAILLAACSGPMLPKPTARPELSAATPSPSPTQTPATLSADAPLRPTDCGWPDTAVLAFAGFATVADLDAQQIIIPGDSSQHLFALVTRDRVELHPMIGSPMLERGFCALRQDPDRERGARRLDVPWHPAVAHGDMPGKRRPAPLPA
jgi:hypothetical protein